MNAIICTLFENHHHYGVGALTNSLYAAGFRGCIYAGYRGKLPPWCSSAKQNSSLHWPEAYTYQVAEGLTINFLKVDTNYHFASYKPCFMVQLWEGLAKDADALVYFDPDIALKCKWTLIETWMTHGVALVHESIGGDIPPTHPKRREWEKLIYDSNRKPTRTLYSYINSGFCGVTKANVGFCKLWLELSNTAIQLGKVRPEKWRTIADPNYAFFTPDQDLFNVAAMCSEAPISEMGPEAMDFLPGGFIMSHSIGYLKPWMKRFIQLSLKGRPPSSADKTYWRNVETPIALFSRNQLKMKRVSLTIASFIGRFYRRS